MYILDLLQWLANAGVAPPEIKAAVRGGCLNLPNPPRGDPKLLSVMGFWVGKDDKAKAVYTMLFAINANFYRFISQPTGGAGSGCYTLVSFDKLTASEFADTVIKMYKAFDAYIAQQKKSVQSRLPGDDLPTVGNPINRPALPSSGLANAETPYVPTYGQTPGPVYAQTPDDTTYSRTPHPVTKTGAGRRVASLRKLFGS